MSASLVGSEMCIRDRSRTTQTIQEMHVNEIAPEFYELTSSSEVQRGTAVSYTHLTLPTICSV
eukprot:264423-Alexandrium_andersonii.AAC.1